MQMNHDREPEVIGRIARGDESALAELYASHAQVLYNFAVRLLGSADAATEAVSDLFLSTWSGVAGMSGVRGPVGPALVSRMREMLLTQPGIPGERRPVRDVDLWALVSQPQSAGPVPEEGRGGARNVAAWRRQLERCGADSVSVLSLVYFGGYGISEVAARFSMTPAECRSRLHGCLAALSGEGRGGRPERSHNRKFSVSAAAYSLGALAREDDPGYFEHAGGGCAECAEEISLFTRAANALPELLPAVKLPPELLEKILFSLRLALIAGSGPRQGAGNGRLEPAAPAGGRSAPAAGRVRPAPERRRRVREIAAISFAVAAVAAIAVLAIRDRSLSRRVEEQSALLESLQERHTDLMLKYDRLAGISGFFESKGVVTVLSGSDEYPGLAGKIVWDTAGGSAMLQILNPPGGLESGKIRVRAVGEEDALGVAEFRGDMRDSGGVLYRFFPLDIGQSFLAEGFTVDAARGGSDDPGSYTEIMTGAIPGRQ